MSEGAVGLHPGRLTISVAGVAGLGLVLFGLARRGGTCQTQRRVFPRDRTAVRQAALQAALQLIEAKLAADESAVRSPRS